jgi:hypothetical protein
MAVTEQQKKADRTLYFENTGIWNSAFSGTLSAPGRARCHWQPARIVKRPIASQLFMFEPR